MARTAPKLAVSKLDLESLFAMQKANLESLSQVQHVWIDAAHAIFRLQHGWVQDVVKGFEGAGQIDAQKKPDAYLADAKANAEKAMAVVKQGFDLGVKAQSEVAQILSRRATANIDEMKGFAAA
jgi:hypothetical protein